MFFIHTILSCEGTCQQVPFILLFQIVAIRSHGHVPGHEGGALEAPADHLQVALIEEDFKKARDLKTIASHPHAPVIDKWDLIDIASQPELSGLFILSLCVVVHYHALPSFHCFKFLSMINIITRCLRK